MGQLGAGESVWQRRFLTTRQKGLVLLYVCDEWQAQAENDRVRLYESCLFSHDSVSDDSSTKLCREKNRLICRQPVFIREKRHVVGW